MPFNMEINQAFIAAILTVIGYSQMIPWLYLTEFVNMQKHIVVGRIIERLMVH